MAASGQGQRQHRERSRRAATGGHDSRSRRVADSQKNDDVQSDWMPPTMITADPEQDVSRKISILGFEDPADFVRTSTKKRQSAPAIPSTPFIDEGIADSAGHGGNDNHDNRHRHDKRSSAPTVSMEGTSSPQCDSSPVRPSSLSPSSPSPSGSKYQGKWNKQGRADKSASNAMVAPIPPDFSHDDERPRSPRRRGRPGMTKQHTAPIVRKPTPDVDTLNIKQGRNKFSSFKPPSTLFCGPNGHDADEAEKSSPLQPPPPTMQFDMDLLLSGNANTNADAVANDSWTEPVADTGSKPGGEQQRKGRSRSLDHNLSLLPEEGDDDELDNDDGHFGPPITLTLPNETELEQLPEDGPMVDCRVIEVGPGRRGLQRQVSGLGLEDPIFGHVHDKMNPIHASNIFDDMDVADVPADMRDMISTVSDHTDPIDGSVGDANSHDVTAGSHTDNSHPPPPVKSSYPRERIIRNANNVNTTAFVPPEGSFPRRSNRRLNGASGSSSHSRKSEMMSPGNSAHSRTPHSRSVAGSTHQKVPLTKTYSDSSSSNYAPPDGSFRFRKPKPRGRKPAPRQRPSSSSTLDEPASAGQSASTGSNHNAQFNSSAVGAMFPESGTTANVGSSGSNNRGGGNMNSGGAKYQRGRVSRGTLVPTKSGSSTMSRRSAHSESYVPPKAPRSAPSPVLSTPSTSCSTTTTTEHRALPPSLDAIFSPAKGKSRTLPTATSHSRAYTTSTQSTRGSESLNYTEEMSLDNDCDEEEDKPSSLRSMDRDRDVDDPMSKLNGAFFSSHSPPVADTINALLMVNTPQTLTATSSVTSCSRGSGTSSDRHAFFAPDSGMMAPTAAVTGSNGSGNNGSNINHRGIMWQRRASRRGPRGRTN